MEPWHNVFLHVVIVLRLDTRSALHISSNKLSMSLTCCMFEQLELVHVHESEMCILSRRTALHFSYSLILQSFALDHLKIGGILSACFSSLTHLSAVSAVEITSPTGR